MTSVALATRSRSGNSEDDCSDLNQVVLSAEPSIVEIAGQSLSVQFGLSPNVKLVAVRSVQLEAIVLNLCAAARSLLGPGGRIVIETRGVNDAPFGEASGLDAVRDMQARVVVRAEQPRQLPALGLAARSPLKSEFGFAPLEELLGAVGARLEFVPLSGNDLVFVAHLPNAPFGESSGRMAVAVPQKPGVILLVEDEPQVQAVTARILRAFGYAVVTANNERTALAQAEQHGAAISLVVSDLVLPGVSGKDLVRRLRQPCQHARVLYISGYSLEHVGALTDGACFLRKPFTAQELLAIVRQLLPQSCC